MDEHFVTINRKGALAKANYGFTRGEKRIPIDSITSVQYKSPKLSNGYIQFTLGGGNEGTRGVMQATKDENSVVFSSTHAPEFDAIRQYIERRITDRFAAQRPATHETSRSVAQELAQLADLRDRGVLTAEEFEQQKARLLQ